MKYIILLLCIVGLFSCKKNKAKDLLDVPFHFSSKNEFTLPKLAEVEIGIPESTVTVTTPAIANTIPDEFSKNHLDINKIKSIAIEGLVLTIKNPPSQTFSFMKSIKIYLGANGIGEKLIATKENINSINPAPNSISLDPTNADIAAYVKSPTYYLKIETVLVRTYTTDILMEAEIKFYAVANPLN